MHGSFAVSGTALGMPKSGFWPIHLDSEPIVILGRGSSLIGGVIRTELTRAEVEHALIEGFFPEAGPSDYPDDKPKVGMREMGLPMSGPGCNRHLAKFLGRQAQGDPSPEVR